MSNTAAVNLNGHTHSKPVLVTNNEPPAGGDPALSTALSTAQEAVRGLQAALEQSSATLENNEQKNQQGQQKILFNAQTIARQVESLRRLSEQEEQLRAQIAADEEERKDTAAQLHLERRKEREAAVRRHNAEKTANDLEAGNEELRAMLRLSNPARDARRRKLAKITKEINEREAQLDEIVAEHQEWKDLINADIEKFKRQQADASDELAETLGRQIQAGIALKEELDKLTLVQSQLREVKKEQAKTQGENEQLIRTQESIGTQIEEKQAELKSLVESIGDKRTHLSGLKSQEEEKQARVKELRGEIASLHHMQQQFRQATQRERKRLLEVRERSQNAWEKFAEMEMAIATLRIGYGKEIAQHREELRTLQDDILAADARLNAAQTQEQERLAQASAAEQRLAELRGQILALQQTEQEEAEAHRLGKRARTHSVESARTKIDLLETQMRELEKQIPQREKEAREASERLLADARREAEDVVTAALEQGIEAAQLLASAQEEAKALRANAQRTAHEMVGTAHEETEKHTQAALIAMGEQEKAMEQLALLTEAVNALGKTRKQLNKKIKEKEEELAQKEGELSRIERQAEDAQLRHQLARAEAAREEGLRVHHSNRRLGAIKDGEIEQALTSRRGFLKDVIDTAKGAVLGMAVGSVAGVGAEKIKRGDNQDPIDLVIDLAAKGGNAVKNANRNPITVLLNAPFEHPIGAGGGAILGALASDWLRRGNRINGMEKVLKEIAEVDAQERRDIERHGAGSGVIPTPSLHVKDLDDGSKSTNLTANKGHTR